MSGGDGLACPASALAEGGETYPTDESPIAVASSVSRPADQEKETGGCARRPCATLASGGRLGLWVSGQQAVAVDHCRGKVDELAVVDAGLLA